MKTPDKIYIHPNYEPSGGWITTERREYQPDDVWETEYIRKDALLAKLGEMSIAVNSFTHDSANDFRAEGANKVISLVKEYIESL